MLRLPKKSMLIMALLVVAALFITACGQKQQQSGQDKTDTVTASKYPEKEITLICPWSSGGSSDLLDRALAQSANKILPKPVVGKGLIIPLLLLPSRNKGPASIFSCKGEVLFSTNNGNKVPYIKLMGVI